ncbi:hypothetical protein, unlikely [Trypanosoma brucei gambiense DAL972]|uniref:Uncharacterized protein n=1 Tax=Trypanosoma brucei gambiense (strain MHOM/CI/86/DAL972) TaxID=679716 RepID=C9ZKL0_TRYB9|nr:hypothetical protein, unlikely [Trypanosoma brucei gambiense DAL972]CBH09976.1 hypothetical protein, unlikely [Trypanosoma brucei gambiense DAL972]|eukprot:XP_011772267.1 hypothetical protein, unlikely [Trypanosoma brucei gambiense DAL972]
MWTSKNSLAIRILLVTMLCSALCCVALFDSFFFLNASSEVRVRFADIVDADVIVVMWRYSILFPCIRAQDCYMFTAQVMLSSFSSPAFAPFFYFYCLTQETSGRKPKAGSGAEKKKSRSFSREILSLTPLSLSLGLSRTYYISLRYV